MKTAVILISIPASLFIPWTPAPAQSPAHSATPPSPACSLSLRLGRPELTGPFADFARAAELVGAVPLRPRMIRRPSDEMTLAACEAGPAIPWLERLRDEPRAGELRIDIIAPRWSNHFNSAYPNDRNNGALWAGRGISTALDGGVTARWRRGPAVVSAALAPTLIFQENHDFRTVTSVRRSGYSPFIYPWHATRIDWPQRFGDRSFWVLNPGQSYIRVDAYNAALGFSTENLWWGPALRNPLMLSNTAPGFPHFFLGTSRPVDVRIGRLEARAVWGRLGESDYFDSNAANDRRLFAGLALDFEPRGLPGLFLGFSRVYMAEIPPEGFSFSDYVLRPYRNVRSNALGAGNPLADNQLFAFYARWALPEAGFEAYAEWAREDHWDDFDDLVMELDHSQAYTLGFQKVTTTRAGWLRLYGEWAYLQSPTTYRSGRPQSTIYTHVQLRQGYTHRGQLLGASIGPGSDAQIIGADLFTGWGRIGVFGERVRRDNDAYYNIWARSYGYHGHDVELTGGLRQLLFDGRFRIGWGLAYSHRYNRNFLALDDPAHAPRTEGNWALDLDVTWRPPALWPVAPLPVSADREAR